MKKILSVFTITSIVLILLANSNGQFTADYTGSTGLGQSCAQIGCHEGAGTMGVDTAKLWVRVLDAAQNEVNSYTLNQQYTVEIRYRLDGAQKVGFQCTSLFGFSTNKAGTVSNTLMPSYLQVWTDPNGREYVSHTSSGTGNAVMSGGYAIWKYKWTAPSTSPQAIFFHVAVNHTDNNNLKTGDSIHISPMKVLQLPTATGSFASEPELNLYPNPANDVLQINASMHSIRTLRILDLHGRLMKEIHKPGSSIPIQDLPQGNYVCLFDLGSRVITKIVTKE